MLLLQCSSFSSFIDVYVYGVFDKENATNIMFKKCPFSCQALYKRHWIMKWNQRRGVIASPLSFVYGPAVTYLRIISHHCNASESNFKENLGIRDILIHQVIKLSKFTLSCICNKCWGVGQYGVITMMISLEAFWLVRNFWMIDMSELWIMFYINLLHPFLAI